MDAREAALRFRMGGRLALGFLRKVSTADRELLRELVHFVGEPKLAGRIVRLVPPELAKDFFELALEPSPVEEVPAVPEAWARRQRREAARRALRVLLEAAEKKSKRAFEMLSALLSSEEPDAAWGKKVREAVARFGVARVKELASRILGDPESRSLEALLAERLICLAVHMARSPDALRALVEDARRDARSGETRPRAAVAVARALKGVDPELARPELERLKVRVKHRVVLREVERSLAALGEGAPSALPPGVSLDEKGELVLEGKEGRRAAEEILSIQRALLEQEMIDERSFGIEEWRGRFVGHAVLENLARRVLWLGDGKPVFFTGRRFEDLSGRSVEPRALVVAHPVKVSALARAQARADELGIVPPFRQLHRETYTVTASERGVFACLRFANEVVPWGTLYALTKQRGWSGVFTDIGEGPRAGRKNFAQGVRARLAIDEARNAPGVCVGALTFETPPRPKPPGAPRPRRHRGGAPEPNVKRTVTQHVLGEVPPVVFSEACRDLDLVIGVASIGEDRTGVVPSSLASRRELVLRLLPALGLGDRVKVEGRVVRVKGDLHEYRVHLGSARVHIIPSERAIVFPEGERAPEVHLPVEAREDPRALEVLRRVLVLAGDVLVSDPELAQQLAEA
jgi:hypothetical protein